MMARTAFLGLVLLVFGHPALSQTAVMERIGEQGAARYAASRGLTPILLDYDKSIRQGFDQVYRDGRKVIVIEAKGGNGRLGIGYGEVQASKEWAIKVAKSTLARSNATLKEIEAARQVLGANNTGNLSIEVVRTRMKEGELRTVVEKVVTTNDAHTVRHCLWWLAVMAEGYHRISNSLSIETDYLEGRLDAVQRDTAHLKNVGSSIGALGTSGIMVAMVGPHGIVISIVAGGIGYLVGDFIGSNTAHFVADWLHAQGVNVTSFCQIGIEKTIKSAQVTWAWIESQAGTAYAWTKAQGAVVWDWTANQADAAYYWTKAQSAAAYDWTANQADAAYVWTSSQAGATYDWTKVQGAAAYDWTANQAEAAWNWSSRYMPSFRWP